MTPRHIPQSVARAACEAVSAETGVAIDILVGDSRQQHVVAARWRVMKILYDRGASPSAIGRALQLDRTTVIHGLNRLAEIERVGRQ